LLEMAWYIAIHDHDILVTQHGLASYVTKFESQSFRLRSKFGVAFAQQESCWRSQQSAVSSQQSAVSSQQSAVSSQQSAVSSQQSAVSSQQSAVCVCVKVKGQGEGQTLAIFLELVSKLLCCAYFTENKGLLTEQALLVSKESLFRQQAFGPFVQTLLFYACCFTDKTGYYKSKLTSFTEDPGCHRISLCMSFACRTAAKLGPCCQPCFTATDLLLLPTPHMRYKRFLCQ